jgi:hypothetical protein
LRQGGAHGVLGLYLPMHNVVATSTQLEQEKVGVLLRIFDNEEA